MIVPSLYSLYPISHTLYRIPKKYQNFKKCSKFNFFSKFQKFQNFENFKNFIKFLNLKKKIQILKKNSKFA